MTLRPWTLDDVEPARVQHDEEMAHWFGFAAVVPSAEQQGEWITESLRGYADDRRAVVLAIEHHGEIAGSVDLKQRADRVGHLSWAVYPRHRGQGVATRAVRLLIDYAFDQLGLARVQAEVEVGNLISLRTAGRVGLRREGVARSLQSASTRRPDFVILARLATDPPPQSLEGFRGVLNAGLPTKRVITQGLVRDTACRFLLCELTYKREWDLPGGVVDGHESPATGLLREIREELGLELPTRGLLAVDWMPPWRGWDDACLFVFNLGVHDERLLDSMVLEAREIAAVHWCTLADAEPHIPRYLDVLLRHLLAQPPGTTAYLENGLPRG